ncbi:secretin N-terminal domain-containing protein [Sulfurisoma sediminicola]|uniref:General secretion pathway protein D n=1 Tax=Sulfurisoma sediminicola TaxID=1381557 RepID=A0A497XB86_9PROT|nr:secretin N-terminal domain-containing protein [Sulfurisoma sediminicola]RLJ63519.1 general secretion pathway protein D [Sulfurisoma sediminicola]
MKRLIALLSLLLLLGACASGNGLFREGQQLAEQGRLEEALPRFEAALRETPNRAEVRLAVASTRERLAGQALQQADLALAQGRRNDADALAARALALDPGNARARKLLDSAQFERRRAQWQIEAEAAWGRGDADAALARLQAILAEAPSDAAALRLREAIEASLTLPAPDPKLAAALARPVSIEFKDASLKQVFEVLARTSGINFVFDKDVKADQPSTVYLRRATVKEVLAAVLMSQQLEQRVIDAGTILVYPNTPAKARDHQALTIKTFYLTNADAKTVAGTLRTILKAKDIVVDEKQNMIVMRDTPEAVRLTEKLLAVHDLPEPEVMLEVEILEVKRSRLLDLGIRWPDQLALTPLPGTAGGTLTLSDVLNATSRSLGAQLPPLVISAGKSENDTNLLANPRIRTRNRETAKIMIGDRVPNITATATATGFVAESVQYVDVGLKLDVQPTIYLDNQVLIRINLEVSSIVDQVKTKAGTLAYQIGTRNASTVLRLKDGENQVLAGLISDAERSSANKVPGLGDLPLIGRLFGSRSDDGQKTELMLSITPRLVRSVNRPALARTEFDSGTEASLRARGPDLSAYTEAVPPSQPAAPAETAPAR